MMETADGLYIDHIQLKMQRQARRHLKAQDSRKTAGGKYRRQNELKALRRNVGRKEWIM